MQVTWGSSAQSLVMIQTGPMMICQGKLSHLDVKDKSSSEALFNLKSNTTLCLFPVLNLPFNLS